MSSTKLTAPQISSLPTITEPQVSAVAPVTDRVPLELNAKWLTLAELSQRKVAWQHLVNHAAWRNAFMEPNFLLPALKSLASPAVRVLVVENTAAKSDENLVALVPLEFKRIYRLPFRAAEIWKHDHCFDATPLLHEACTTSAWEAVCQALIAKNVAILGLDTVSAESQIENSFSAVETKNTFFRFQRERFERAAFVPATSFEVYAKKYFSKGMRKDFRQSLSRLQAIGDVTWEHSDSSSDFQRLAEEFLALEASGWKGAENTALVCQENEAAFFREMVRQSAAAGKINFFSLVLDGQKIAMLVDVVTGSQVYGYKTAYSEIFAKFSPGKLLETKNIENLHRNGTQLADSCTSPNNQVLNRIWKQKLAFQKAVVSLKPGISRHVVRSLPVVRTVIRRLRGQ